MSHYKEIRFAASKIACCPNGDLVVYAFSKGVFLLDVDGTCKKELITSEAEKEKQIGLVRFGGIAVSNQGHIVISDDTKFVKVFKADGSYLSCFPVDNYAQLIATDKDNLLLGDALPEEGKINIHTSPDGSLKKSIKYTMPEYIGFWQSMVVNSKSQILHHFTPLGSMYSKVVVTDDLGKEVCSFTPKLDADGIGGEDFDSTGKPHPKFVDATGIACDSEDNIYIGMHVHNEIPTGQLYKYDSTGKFLSCIAEGLEGPYGLSFTRKQDGTPDSQLVVATGEAILFYDTK